MATKVYSFRDHRVVISHPDVGTYVLSNGGIGRITVSYSGENARMTTTADGSVIVNKMENNSGTINIEVPQVGDANNWLKKFTNYLKSAPTARFALGRIQITGSQNDDIVCTGVVTQKHADVVFDAEAQNRTWPLLAADIKMR